MGTGYRIVEKKPNRCWFWSYHDEKLTWFNTGRICFLANVIIKIFGSTVKYTVQAENIRSWRLKIYDPWAENIRSSAWNIRSAKIYGRQMLKIYGPVAENIRSFRVKYTVHKNCKWIVNERKYTVLSLKIYGPLKS